MSRQTTQRQPGQDGQFGQMENAIGLPHKDDDLVAVGFFEAQAPARRPFPTEQGGMQIGLPLGLITRPLAPWACHKRKAVQRAITSRVK